jgi:hypothetical protein
MKSRSFVADAWVFCYNRKNAPWRGRVIMTVSADFPFESKYIEVSGVRMHFIEQGRSDGPVFLFMHGNPTW